MGLGNLEKCPERLSLVPKNETIVACKVPPLKMVTAKARPGIICFSRPDLGLEILMIFDEADCKNLEI